MLEFLPKEISESLRAAQISRAKRRSRLRLRVGDVEHPILRLWVDGMALDAGLVGHLRGLVDVFDGARHILQALIVASRVEGGLMICEFKRSTLVSERPALDYARDPDAPAGLLPRH